MTILNIFIYSLALGGFGVLTWTWLVDHPSVSTWLKSRTPFIGKVLHCGVCLMTWLGFFAVFIFNPLSGWDIALRFEAGAMLDNVLHFIVSWFALTAMAVFWRYFILVWVEMLKHFIKNLNAK